MVEGDALELDHILPVRLHGPGGQTRIVHAQCNSKRGARLGGHLRHVRRAQRKAPEGGHCRGEWLALTCALCVDVGTALRSRADVDGEAKDQVTAAAHLRAAGCWVMRADGVVEGTESASCW